MEKAINSLHLKQREVFNVIHTCANGYVKNNEHDAKAVHIFFLGSRGTVKSHLVKAIYNAKSKSLLYHCKEFDKPRVLLLGPSGILAVNIAGTTIHCGFGIKAETKILGWKNKSKAALRNRLLGVKLWIIHELSMVSSDLSTAIDSQLGEIFMIISEKAFSYDCS